MGRSVQATATIIEARRADVGPEANGSSGALLDAVELVGGGTPWRLVLEVQQPGLPSYRVEGVHSMPNRLFGLRGMLSSSLGLAAGVVLPVEVDADDPQRVQVDWKALAARPGARKELQAAYEGGRAERSRQVAVATSRKDPAGHEKRAAQIRSTASDFVGEVHAGRQTLATLDQFLETNVRLELLTAEEADGYRQAAAGG